MPRLFGVIGLARDTLHREAPELARDADHVVIDGPPRVAGLMRSALLAADLVLIPAQPSPFDGWASAEMLRLIDEARIFRPQLVARFVLNRCAARTVIARETAEALADHDPPVLATHASASASLSPTPRGPAGSSSSIDTARPAAREIAALAAEVERVHAMSARPAEAQLRISPGDPEAGSARPSLRPRREAPTLHRAADDRRHAELRGRIKVAAFQRGQTVADMLRAPARPRIPRNRWRTAMIGNRRLRTARLVRPTHSPMSS